MPKTIIKSKQNATEVTHLAGQLVDVGGHFDVLSYELIDSLLVSLKALRICHHMFTPICHGPKVYYGEELLAVIRAIEKMLMVDEKDTYQPESIQGDLF